MSRRVRPPTRRLLPCGDDAVLVDCPDGVDSAALQRWLRRHRPAPVAETVPGATTVLVRLRGPELLDATLRAALLGASADPDPATGLEPLTVPVAYDGPDLQDVAEELAVTPAEVIARHTRAAWTVSFGGFVPGFGYLTGPDDLQVSRRPSPRTAVPAGAVALAGRWSGIYPRTSPGGWRLIGHTDLVLFDPDRDPPALLVPGREVRFRSTG